MSAARFFWAVFLTLAPALPARATETVCAEAANAKYGYGEKARLRFSVSDQPAFTQSLQRWAGKNGFSYSSVGFEDPDQHPAFRRLTQDLQLIDYGDGSALLIAVVTDNRSTAAHAWIETFSFQCGRVAEPWGPQWRKFLQFIEGHYPHT